MEWLRIVHECLYGRARVGDDDLRAHPYLWNLAPLIKHSSMTINYNFDDSVERILYLHNKHPGVAQNDDKGFEVVWQPSSQFRRHRGVIYHPNGFLPLERIDGFSEQIVFMEQEFADQLIDIGAGHYAALLSHLSNNTIVFLGLSLSDANLKHMLHLTARNNPGNFHYYIHYCTDTKPSRDEQDAIRKANFDVYRLVTLFLDAGDIEELVKLLVMSDEDFSAQCEQEPDGLETQYRYYVTGAVGCGKTTCLEQIRSVSTFDEWTDRKLALLGRPHVELSNEERRSVDEWINSQFRKKNRRLTTPPHLLALVDRSPLDPLCFIKGREHEQARALELLNAMVPRNGAVSRIAPGHIILLKCDPVMLEHRLASRDKTYKADQLDGQIDDVNRLWRDVPTTVIDTTHMTAAQVVSRVLGVVLFDSYRPVDLDAMCKTKAGVSR